MATNVPPPPNVVQEEQQWYLKKADPPIPLYSWYKSKTGDRLFCIVAIGGNGKRWVLEKGLERPFERPLEELQRLIKEGNWIPYSYF